MTVFVIGKLEENQPQYRGGVFAGLQAGIGAEVVGGRSKVGFKLFELFGIHAGRFACLRNESGIIDQITTNVATLAPFAYKKKPPHPKTRWPPFTLHPHSLNLRYRSLNHIVSREGLIARMKQDIPNQQIHIIIGACKNGITVHIQVSWLITRFNIVGT